MTENQDGVDALIGALEEAQADAIQQTIRRIRDEIPSYENVPDPELHESVAKNIERCLHVIRTGEVPEESSIDTVTKRIAAQRSARAVPIEDMVRAYRMCLRPVYEMLLHNGTTLGIPSAWLLDRSWSLWRLGDWFMTSIELDYRYSLASDLFNEVMEREELATSLLEGGAVDSDLLHRLQLAGYAPDGRLDVHVTERIGVGSPDERTRFGAISRSQSPAPLSTAWRALHIRMTPAGGAAPAGNWAAVHDVPYDDVPRVAALAARVWSVRGSVPAANVLTVEDVGWRAAVCPQRSGAGGGPPPALHHACQTGDPGRRRSGCHTARLPG